MRNPGDHKIRRLMRAVLQDKENPDAWNDLFRVARRAGVRIIAWSDLPGHEWPYRVGGVKFDGWLRHLSVTDPTFGLPVFPARHVAKLGLEGEQQPFRENPRRRTNPGPDERLRQAHRAVVAHPTDQQAIDEFARVGLRSDPWTAFELLCDLRGLIERLDTDLWAPDPEQRLPDVDQRSRALNESRIGLVQAWYRFEDRLVDRADQASLPFAERQRRVGEVSSRMFAIIDAARAKYALRSLR